MIYEINPATQNSNSIHAGWKTSLSCSNDHSGAAESFGPQQPIIEVSECDDTFNVYADFRTVLDNSEAPVVVKFAQQGMILAGGAVQRYLPIPTDALIMHARVTIDGGIARISIPTADSGHRWRSIVMW